jgi:YtkA-like
MALVAAGSITAGCRPTATLAPAATLTWTLSPTPPHAGPATLRVVLRDARGRSLAGATVGLEGHMSHPGMAPVLASATERGPGVYDVPFAFTMPGDWILVVSALLPDGTRIERRVEVATVRP